MKAILKFLREAQPNAKVILLTPSTIDVAAWITFCTEQGLPSEFADNRSPESIKQIRDAVLQVAKDENVGVVDVWKLHDDAVNRGELQTSELFWDGLHYSERAYAVSITAQGHFEA
jgi:lysophospholipase L1-like esterase